MTSRSQHYDHTLTDGASLFGRIGMVLCRHWGGTTGDCDGDERRAARGVMLTPKLLRGRTQQFTPDDWWIFYDALEAHPVGDPLLDEIRTLAFAGIHGELPPGPTRAFPEDGDCSEE